MLKDRGFTGVQVGSPEFKKAQRVGSEPRQRVGSAQRVTETRLTAPTKTGREFLELRVPVGFRWLGPLVGQHGR